MLGTGADVPVELYVGGATGLQRMEYHKLLVPGAAPLPPTTDPIGASIPRRARRLFAKGYRCYRDALVLGPDPLPVEDFLSLVLRMEFGGDCVSGGIFALEGASACARFVSIILMRSARGECIYCGAEAPAFDADPTPAAHRAAACALFPGCGVSPMLALLREVLADAVQELARLRPAPAAAAAPPPAAAPLAAAALAPLAALPPHAIARLVALATGGGEPVAPDGAEAQAALQAQLAAAAGAPVGGGAVFEQLMSKVADLTDAHSLDLQDQRRIMSAWRADHPPQLSRALFDRLVEPLSVPTDVGTPAHPDVQQCINVASFGVRVGASETQHAASLWVTDHFLRHFEKRTGDAPGPNDLPKVAGARNAGKGGVKGRGCTVAQLRAIYQRA